MLLYNILKKTWRRNVRQMKNVIITFLLLQISIVSKGQSPDLILTNGKIFTSDTSQLYVDALAIKNGRIIAIGTTMTIEKMAQKDTKQINLEGKLVVPGFNDAHNHLPGGFNATSISFNETDPSWQTLLDSLQKVVNKTPAGHWIEARIGPSIANSLEATRFILDKITTKHPVRLLSWWGHVGLFNTLGMKEMGISETQPDPKGGFYERMSDGKILTGKAFEKNAYDPHTSYQKFASMRDEKMLVGELRGMTQAMLKMGITSFQNMCTGATAGDYIKIWEQAGLPFRLRLIRWGDMNADGTLSIPGKELPKNIKKLPLLTVSGTKWLLEGTPIEQGAEHFEAYPNRPDWHGRMNYSILEIEKMCREAIARHDQIMFHIGGDKSMGKLLDLMENLKIDWKPLRPRFEHGDEIDFSPKYLEKAKQMGIIIVQNPTHFASVEGFAMPKIPPKHGMAMKSLLKYKIPLAIGSDGPFNPFLNIMVATTHPLRPSEALTREEAVIAYTRTSAFAEFEEQNKGTLTIGKVADLSVLSQDIFKITIPELMRTESLLTMINGKIVYETGFLKVKQ